MEALHSSEMLITTYQTTRCHNPDDNNMTFEDINLLQIRDFWNVTPRNLLERYPRFEEPAAVMMKAV
jgi:hypothetical protein